LDSAIAALHEAVVAAKFQDADALVNLAMLQMRRSGGQPGVGCDNDRACAKLNVQRALAVDDGYMPAFNQLALYTLQEAKRKAAADGGLQRRLVAAQGDRRELSGQMLDLAALVCSQALRKNPRYASIHNTLGLIEVEQRNITAAVQSFQRARALDPRFFEAHMNYAAVNLSFRGFQQAEGAYRQALAMRPDSYEAHLGLALALRGRLRADTMDRALPAVESALAEAKRVDPARPEAYFNEAILIQEFKAKYADGDEQKLALYDRALAVFDTFLRKAGPSLDYGEAIEAAKQRKEDIAKIREFILAGMQQRQGARAPQAN
jgi:cytochrome c-type biogenesis protein CcmH/NrfG